MDNFKITFKKASYFAVLSAFIFAITNILEKISLNRVDFWTAFAILRIGFFLSLIIILPLCYKDLIQTFKQLGKKIGLVFFYEGFSMIGTLFFLIALSYGYASLTTTMAAIQPLFTFILATVLSVFFPNIILEKINKNILTTKIISIVLIFIGTILIL